MIYFYSESDNEKNSLGHFVVQELNGKSRLLSKTTGVMLEGHTGRSQMERAPH